MWHARLSSEGERHQLGCSGCTRLRQICDICYYGGSYGQMPVTLALLRLDPIWDPLRGDPVFQKLCEEKKP